MAGSRFSGLGATTGSGPTPNQRLYHGAFAMGDGAGSAAHNGPAAAVRASSAAPNARRFMDSPFGPNELPRARRGGSGSGPFLQMEGRLMLPKRACVKRENRLNASRAL